MNNYMSIHSASKIRIWRQVLNNSEKSIVVKIEVKGPQANEWTEISCHMIGTMGSGTLAIEVSEDITVEKISTP